MFVQTTTAMLYEEQKNRQSKRIQNAGLRILKRLASREGIMKIWMLVVTVISLSLTCTGRADDLPGMGYSSGTPLKDLLQKGYRWVTVDGPYACPTEQEARQITGDRTDSTELNLVEDGGAYYLIPGTLVRVVQDDPANGMSRIIWREITRPLWPYTRFLSARPIRDTYGILETPDTNGLIDQATPQSPGKPVEAH